MKYLVIILLVAACGPIAVKPVKVEPIHMTIDVNLHDGNPRQADPLKR